jgi:hypothetical protein
MYINSTREGLHHPSFKSLVFSKKNLVSRSGPKRSTNFEFEKLGEFETEFEKNLGKLTGAQMESIDE